MSRKYEKSKAFTTLFKRTKVIYKYLLDPKVNIFKKLMVVGAFIYIFSPLDFIPEIVLGIGLIDDVVLYVFLISLIADELDRYIEKTDELGNDEKHSKVIEVDFQRVDEDK